MTTAKTKAMSKAVIPIDNVTLNGKVVIGEVYRTVEETKRIHSGDVIHLLSKNSDPVSLFIDSKEVAKVEIYENSGMFWVKVVEII